MKFRMILGLSVLFLSMAGAAIDDPPGNLNDDGVIDIEDMVLFAQQWLDGPGGTADFVGNDGVNFADYAYFAQNWYYTPMMITEFMAKNDTFWTDGNGAYSDWIEIYNPEPDTISLKNWYLTDDPNDSNKWAFPDDASIGGNSYLVVVASGQTVQPYVDPLDYYHTNFKLDAGGEYLALVHGSQIIHSYAPEYPNQTSNISYGRATSTLTSSNLIFANYPSLYFVPIDGSLGTSWTQTSFNDASWRLGYTGIGYEMSPGDSVNYSLLIQTDIESLMHEFGQQYDLDLDFETATVNPNGAWSYGYIDTSGFSLLTDGIFDPDKGSARYGWRYPVSDWDSHGNLQKILEGEANFEAYSSYRYGGEMCNGPGATSGVRTAARWTCPADGDYDILALWQGLSTKAAGTTVDVTLELNGASLFTSYVAGFIGCPGEEPTGTQPETSYSTFLSLVTGDTLDMTIAGGSDGISADCTNMDLTIASSGPDRVRTSVYLRIPFEVNSFGALTSLKLYMKSLLSKIIYLRL